MKAKVSWSRSLIHLESIARDGRVDFLSVAINSAIDAEGVFQSVSPKPGAVIQHAATLVVEEDDFLFLVLVRKDRGLNFLGHEAGVGERDGFEFLTSAGVEQGESCFTSHERCQLGRLDQHFLIVGVAFLKTLDGVIERDPVFFADPGEAVAGIIGAGLASSDVKG